MKKRRFSDEDGMTLLELMFATGVVGTALAMMFGSLITISSVGAISQERTSAMVLVNSILEEVRVLDQEGLMAYKAPTLKNAPGTVSTAVVLAYDANGAGLWLPTSSQSAFVEGGSTVALANPTEVRVILVWLDARGRIYNVESSTLVEF